MLNQMKIFIATLLSLTFSLSGCSRDDGANKPFAAGEIVHAHYYKGENHRRMQEPTNTTEGSVELFSHAVIITDRVSGEKHYIRNEFLTSLTFR
jgi:hypothetical protein